MDQNNGPRVGPLIGLLTDFGLADPYVSEMKAIILSICSSAQIIDISHLVEKFNIRMGAFILASAAQAFPAGSVYVGVVDPEVGSARRPIVVETDRGVYVGPDNGLLIPAAKTENIRGVYEITDRSLMRANVSSTFHGRDIFAPVAAHVACGVPPRDCGPLISDHVAPSYSQVKVEGGGAFCEVFHVDGFGNVITNLLNTRMSELDLGEGQRLRILLGKKRMLARFVRSYSELKKNELGVLLGSHGFVEMAFRESSLARRVRARTGMVVRISGA